MVSHKLSNTNSVQAYGAAPALDSAAQLAMNYVREFSAQAARYSLHRTEESLVLLNRSASLVSTAIQPQQFGAAQLEMSRFFIDLHTVLDALSTDTDALWSCVAVLQNCSRNLAARRAIVDEYRFLPVLTLVLKRTRALDKVQRVLALLQELTYGVRITWEEPYIVLLLEQLVDIVYSAAEESNEPHLLLALSVLINLCYKNFVVLFLFLRSVNISQFAARIQNYGMLANKMLIILSEDMHTPNEREMHTMVRSTFATIDDCIKQWNVPHLRHIVDFLLDSKAHEVLHQTMLHYDKYCEDIERLLDQLAARGSMDDSNEDTQHQQQLCMGLIFRLIRYILELSGVPEPDGMENVISLDSNVPRIFELLCNWLESDICGVDAVNLLESLVRLAKKETIAPRIARDPSIIVQLIASSEKPDTTPHHVSAILQLLLTLLHQAKTEKLILAKITESYFDKILAPLLAPQMDVAMAAGTSPAAVDEVETPILCLLLLINFAGIAKKAYFDKCCTLLQTQQVQYALARAMRSGNELVCRAVFQISQFEHFPQQQVAQHIAQLNASAAAVAVTVSTSACANSTEQWRHLNAILKNNSSFVGKTEERLNALIEVLTNAQRSNQLNNVATSQIIELYNYKIEKFSCGEASMQQRLQDASQQITHLTQRINLQNAELQKYHTMNFELHISQESLQAQCKDLKQQKDSLKSTMSDLINKLMEKSELHQINEKRLAVKTSELILLQQQHQELREELRRKTEEFEKLQVTTKENATRIEKLKKTIGAYEVDIKEKVHTIEERERELARTQKSLDEQKDAKKKAEDVIGVLETQLQKKNEELRNCELELSETEDLRKTIMSLMESKKPKRKL